ncbi:antitoxin Xre-like helix-turn-helix domain-containing protein [Chromatocurvus halotolerans]|uniref:Antitoxin Xre-like helix-turn-helix domain-containing protein n=1 Tax=Chromatocurvus halotolerans TaxID=1132028 RepID=A0A4V2SB11_9GAMM|nr:hypothetical protein EV688_11547 [Chromatocurvus halotolerans]
MSQVKVAKSQERGRVITVAVLRASETLGLSGKELGRVLGVSEPSVSRLTPSQRVIRRWRVPGYGMRTER